jgi:hypothetical protein
MCLNKTRIVDLELYHEYLDYSLVHIERGRRAPLCGMVICQVAINIIQIYNLEEADECDKYFTLTSKARLES